MITARKKCENGVTFNLPSAPIQAETFVDQLYDCEHDENLKEPCRTVAFLSLFKIAVQVHFFSERDFGAPFTGTTELLCLPAQKPLDLEMRSF